MSPIEIDTIVAPQITFKRSLSFGYKSSTVFQWNENFEGFGTTSGITMKKSINTDTNFTILTKSVSNPNADVFEGAKSFFFTLDDNRPHGKFETTANYPLPNSGGAPVYLELNFKCNQIMTIGVFSGGMDYRPVVTVNPSTTWNKIYSVYGIYFEATKTTTSDNANPYFILDNIKLLSY
jgi:hypothetical protein